MNFLIFLIALVKSYKRRRIRPVCDNGRFHHTQAVQDWLAAHFNRTTVHWVHQAIIADLVS
jgi:hypothetical protein